MSTGSIERNLQRSLVASLARHRVPGASIAVFDAGEMITAAGGVANVSTGVELTPDAVMHIGSITKVFTATLVMQLVDAGQVDLDELVVRYLPDLRLGDGEALQQISVKMLLNHTSGIDGNVKTDLGHDEETLEKGIRRFAERGQIHRPGAEFSYCNAGTVIAGYLAQRLLGKSWYQLVREKIFEPLQMKQAAALPEEALLHRASVGHYLDPLSGHEPVRTSSAFLALSFAPAGATLMMSPRDLLTFATAHMAQGVGANGARILSASSARAMQQVSVNNKEMGYACIDMGLGWMVADDGLLIHGGGGPGISSELYVHPERQFAAAVLTNAAYGSSLINELMAPWLRKFGIQRPLNVVDIHLPAEAVEVDYDRFVGVYEDVTRRYRVSRTTAGLALSLQMKFAVYESMSTEATRPARLIPLGAERFLLQTDGKETSGAYDAYRVFTFRNQDAMGSMQHVGRGLRLFKRTES